MRRHLPALGLALMLSLAPAPGWASETPQLWITDGNGEVPAGLFTDTAVVPGQQITETLLIHHSGAAGAPVELRLAPLTAPNALESDLQLTVHTDTSHTTEPLASLLRERQPICLGALRSADTTQLELIVTLPETSTNRTRELTTAFRPIITAYDPNLSDCPTTEEPENPAPTDDSSPTIPKPSNETSSADPEPPGGTLPTNGAGSITAPAEDSSGGANAIDATGPEKLPHTGIRLAPLLIAALGCTLLGGWLVVRGRDVIGTGRGGA